MTVDDAELVGGVLVDAPDPHRAARDLADILTGGSPRGTRFDPVLVDVLRNRFGDDPHRVERACDLGAAWVMGRRSVTTAEPWELVATLPGGTPLPPGLRHMTGETLVQLVVGATRTLRIAAPFIDQVAISFLSDSLAAATARGVSLEVMLPTRSTHADFALDELERAIRAEGDFGRFSVAALQDDAPWVHLKVLSADGTAAYIGSANVTRAGITGQNLELGILIRGSAVATVEKVLDLFRA
jgi:phosphatidylserine/phosphatidylglycerophosphate/cardiolipin synthase-like enzyme